MVEKMPHKIYENAPLLEVICEIRWQLKPSNLMPHAQNDPYFEDFAEEVKALAEPLGYTHIEVLQQPDFPREIRPYLVESRFRKQQGKWPLFQIGPGIFSINTTPPYGGWTGFRSIIEETISLLFKAYPRSDKYLKISRIELRYINAFDEKNYQFESSQKFFAENFNIYLNKPDNFLADMVDESRPSDVNMTLTTPLKKPQQGEALLVMAKGSNRGIPAFIVQNTVRTSVSDPQIMSQQKVMECLDQSHEVTRATFEGIINSNLRGHIGPELEAEE